MADGASLAKILVVEDDATIRTILGMALDGAGYRNVTAIGRGDEAMEAVRRLSPDLVLLDLMLPGLDGLEICRRIRSVPELSQTRIVMLTARTQNEDILEGLAAGADDYVTKPFDRKILLARVRAVLRRGLTIAEGRSYDGLVLDDAAHAAKLDGREIELTAGEHSLLRRLIMNAGRIFERAADERTVDVQIANLRRKLGAWSRHIETIRGIGYRLVFDD